jgi:hypothetical protein
MPLATYTDLCIDACDAEAGARFWGGLLRLTPGGPHHNGAWWLDDEAGKTVAWVNAVPEPKTAKNRLHLDLHVSGGRHIEPTTRTERIEAMVDRLVGAGGAVQHRDGSFGSLDHVVMTDPEGNEFCVV